MTLQQTRGNLRRSETVSFRITGNVRSSLEDEAHKAGINLNALVSQIFNQYVNWGRYASKLKFLPMSKDLLRELFGPMQRDAIERVARRMGETTAREHILFLFKQINGGTVVRYVELWGNHFDAFEHLYDGRKHYFSVHHDVNLNFSIFAKEYVSSLIQSTLMRMVQFETISPNSVTFNFEG